MTYNELCNLSPADLLAAYDAKLSDHAFMVKLREFQHIRMALLENGLGREARELQRKKRSGA